MQHRLFNFNLIYPSFYILLLTALLSACGGSSNSSNLAPIVNAGSEQTVDEQSSVTLSGSASDSDGSIVSYQWLQTSGTAVTLENAKTIDAAFIAPSVTADETLIFSLTVTDDEGDIASDMVNINITNSVDTNTPPIANAGTDQSVLVGVTVSLSGEQSSDADGDSLSYLWSIVDIPNGSAISLSDESSISPSFEVDIIGSYTVQLVVDDGTDSSEIDSVQISVAEQTVGSTEGILCDYDYSEFNDSASIQYLSSAQWSCFNGGRLLIANGIPDHQVGTFPNAGNPNTISAQTISENYVLDPVQTDTITTLGGPRGSTGYVLNGVKIDASTAGSCDDSGSSCSLVNNSGNWSIEALGQTSFDFGTDDNNAHVQPTGAYHYHGMPEGFISKQGGSSSTMTIIGWAADGFPIYARYGYSEANNAASSLVAMTSSYQLVTSVSASRPDTSVYALGTFAQDWQYVAGSGDLDECNGRYGVSPEFPNGIYHYYATDTYPYFQRCVKGEVDAAGPP